MMALQDVLAVVSSDRIVAIDSDVMEVRYRTVVARRGSKKKVVGGFV